MSRKRTHSKAFTFADNLENGMYLLPGCYYNPELECTCEECRTENAGGTFVLEECPRPLDEDSFNSDGLYIADACGNIFYKSDVAYVICEEISCYSGARMEGDDFSDPGSEFDSKRTRANTTSDEEEMGSVTITKDLGYTVEEPPDEGNKDTSSSDDK